MRRRLTIGAAAAVLAGLAGLYAGAAQLGFQLDRPAWRSEVVLVAEALQQLQRDTDSREIRRLRAEEDALVYEIAAAKAAGRQPDPLAELRLRQVRRQLRDLQGGDHD